MKDRVRKVGRSLGPVRELDVIRDVLDELDTRVPAAMGAIAAARSAVTQELQAARRKMIKTIERLEIDRLAERMPTKGQWLSLPGLRARQWTHALRSQIGERADMLSAAVDHASGVYFPKRAHAARVAAKKLRYNLELADVTALWQPPRLLRDLKRVQETLGELHDRQVILDRLEGLLPKRVAAERDVLNGVLLSDVARLHEVYLETRGRLHAMCGACQRFSDPRGGRRRHWPLAASAVALPTAVLLLGTRAPIAAESTPLQIAAAR